MVSATRTQHPNAKMLGSRKSWCILQLGAGKSIMTISLHSCAFITPRIRTELHLATCSWPSSESSTPRRGVHAPLCSMSPWICGTEQVGRSEEHTSELQSQSNLVCRL